MCLWSNCFSKIDAAMRFFLFVFLLVRFLNRGKRSEMVSVVSRYERNEIWIEYIYFLFINSCTIVCLIPKLPYFLGKYKCYTCSIKLKTLIIWCFSTKKILMRTGWTDARADQRHVVCLGLSDVFISCPSCHYTYMIINLLLYQSDSRFEWLSWTPITLRCYQCRCNKAEILRDTRSLSVTSSPGTPFWSAWSPYVISTTPTA